MVVHLFRQQGSSRHEGPCLTKIVEVIGLFDGVAVAYLVVDDGSEVLRRVCGFKGF